VKGVTSNVAFGTTFKKMYIIHEKNFTNLRDWPAIADTDLSSGHKQFKSMKKKKNGPVS
jgi:hypothetical protein